MTNITNSQNYNLRTTDLRDEFRRTQETQDRPYADDEAGFREFCEDYRQWEQEAAQEALAEMLRNGPDNYDLY